MALRCFLRKGFARGWKWRVLQEMRQKGELLVRSQPVRFFPSLEFRITDDGARGKQVAWPTAGSEG